MRITWVFASIFCSFIAFTCTFTSYPCGVVELMDTYQDARWSKIDIKSYPIAVCISGYSHYYIHNDITDKNGTRRVGLFGTREDDLGKCNKEGDPKGEFSNRMNGDDYLLGSDLEDEVRCLANTVLKSEDTIQFYEKLCQPLLIDNVTCKTRNNQSTGVIQVYDPIYRDLADRIYTGATDLNDELIMRIKKTSTTEMVHSSMPVRNITLASATEPESSTTQKPLVIINYCWNKHIIIELTIILLAMIFLLGCVVYFFKRKMRISINQKRFLASARYDNKDGGGTNHVVRHDNGNSENKSDLVRDGNSSDDKFDVQQYDNPSSDNPYDLVQYGNCKSKINKYDSLRY